MPLIEELHAPCLVVRDEARSLVDLDTPVRALDDVVLHIIGEELGGGLGALLVELQLRQLTLLQDELLVCQLRARQQDPIGVGEREGELQRDVVRRGHSGHRVGDRQFLSGLRGNRGQLHRPRLDGKTLYRELPAHHVAAQVDEEVLVVDLYPSLRCVYHRGAYALVHVAHLVGVRIEATVRADEPVV